MKIVYDQDVDALQIIFSEQPVSESDEEKPGIILDYDEAGNLIGLEVLDASKRMQNPFGVDYSIKTNVA